MPYLTGSRSTFPATLDQIPEKYDLPASLKTSAERYNVLAMKSTRTSAEETEYQGLLVTLANYLFTAEYENYLGDIMVNMQSFVKDTITNYYAFKGDWSASTAYTIFNTVRYANDGCTYLCLQSNTGHAPTETSYWLKNSSDGAKGDKGDPGANLVNMGSYDNDYAYNLNSLVQYNGVTYYCIQATVGHLPTDTDYWAVFLSPPALPVISTQELLITTTNLTTVVTHTPTVAKNIQITTYFRVITATTTVSVQITYTDITGSQTLALLTSQSCVVGSYTLLPVFINSTASAVTVSVTAGTANQVYASASILEV